MSAHSLTSARWDRATIVGMAAVALTAALLSFSSLSGLAGLVGITGRAGWFRLAWLLPVSVDAYAVTATRVWLRTGVSEPTRIYARRNSVGAIALSVAGNATFHGLSAAGIRSLADVHAGWVLVVAVSAVPPILLGLVGHLHALISAEHDTHHTTTADLGQMSAGTKKEETTPTAPPVSGTKKEETSPTAAARPAPPHGRSRPTGTALTRSTPKTAGPGTASTGSGSPTRTSSKGDAEAAMRTHWATERAAGRTPTGAELDRIAGTRDYGRKIRRTLLAEDDPAAAETPADLHSTPTPSTTEHTTTGTDDAANAA